MIYSEWLAGLKAGDKVLVSRDESLVLRQVNKATPTQIVVDDLRYNVTDGFLRGANRLWTARLKEPTKDAMAVMNNRIRRDALRRTNWNAAHFTDETIRAIYQDVEESKAWAKAEKGEGVK